MTTQLTLLPPSQAPWRLDDCTRDIGRRGLANARQALARAAAVATDTSAAADSELASAA